LNNITGSTNQTVPTVLLKQVISTWPEQEVQAVFPGTELGSKIAWEASVVMTLFVDGNTTTITPQNVNAYIAYQLQNVSMTFQGIATASAKRNTEFIFIQSLTLLPTRMESFL